MTNFSDLTKGQLIERLQQLENQASIGGTELNTLELLHQLQVHQVELEMQNRELRETQEELESSRDRYADLYDFAPVGYVTLDRAATVFTINLTGAAMLGVERSAIVGFSFMRFVTAAERSLLDGYLGRILTSGESGSCELHVEVDGKGDRLFLLDGILQRDSGQVSLRATIRDVTQLRIAEDVRRQREAEEVAGRAARRFAASLNRVAAAAMRSFDPDDMLQSVISVLRDLFDVDRAWLVYPCDPHADTIEVKVEATSSDYPGAFVDGGRIAVTPVYQGFLERVLASEGVVTDLSSIEGMESGLRYRVRSKMVVAIRPDADKPWLLGLHQCDRERVWTDEDQALFKIVAERMSDALSVAKLRRDLQQNERRLTLALEGARDAIWDWDIIAETCYISSPWADMLGFDQQRLEPAVSPCPRGIHPDDKAAWDDALLHHLSGDTPQFSSEFRVRRSDGTWCWILARGRAVERMPTGQALRVLGTYADITAMKEQEARLERLLSENRRLIHQGLLIQERERRQLAHDLHDELGQVMAAIRLSAEYLYKKAQHGDPGILAAVVDIRDASLDAYKSVQAITRQLRPAILDCLDLADIFRVTVDNWRTRIPTIDWTFDLTGDADDLTEDVRVTLYRILQEGMTNVVKHASATSVEVRLSREAESVSLSIKDNGQGIVAPLDSAGLGVLGMKERAGAVNGEFVIDSKPGQGVCLSVTIPLEESR